MPDLRRRPLAPYRRAQLRARALAGRLSATSIRAIRQALKEYADTIAGRLAALPADPSPARLRQILRDMHEVVEFAADRLEGRLLQVVRENRLMSFEETREIWERAGDLACELVQRQGLAPGAVSVPGLHMAGAYEALGGAARTWKTLLPQFAQRGAAEVNAIMRGALLQGTSPDKLARVLRKYVVGSRPFETLAREMGLKVNIQDLRSLVQQALHDPRARVLLNVSQTMRHNAERIAFTEVFNARREAEIQQYAEDPMVAAVAWRLAPDRGTLVGADICDDYAAQDLYGLGPGIYPVDKVPAPPHPWCRCELVPVAATREGTPA